MLTLGILNGLSHLIPPLHHTSLRTCSRSHPPERCLSSATAGCVRSAVICPTSAKRRRPGAGARISRQHPLHRGDCSVAAPRWRPGARGRSGPHAPERAPPGPSATPPSRLAGTPLYAGPVRRCRPGLAAKSRVLMHRGKRSAPPPPGSAVSAAIPQARGNADARGVSANAGRWPGDRHAPSEPPRRAQPGEALRCGVPRPIRVHLRTFACICVSLFLCHPPHGAAGAPRIRRRTASSVARPAPCRKGPCRRRAGRAAAAPRPLAPAVRKTAAGPACASADRTSCTRTAAPPSCCLGAAEGKSHAP
jgi:hypothetical protein